MPERILLEYRPPGHPRSYHPDREEARKQANRTLKKRLTENERGQLVDSSGTVCAKLTRRVSGASGKTTLERIRIDVSPEQLAKINAAVAQSGGLSRNQWLVKVVDRASRRAK